MFSMYFVLPVEMFPGGLTSADFFPLSMSQSHSLVSQAVKINIREINTNTHLNPRRSRDHKPVEFQPCSPHWIHSDVPMIHFK